VSSGKAARRSTQRRPLWRLSSSLGRARLSVYGSPNWSGATRQISPPPASSQPTLCGSWSESTRP
jgi:hypothetical protein